MSSSGNKLSNIHKFGTSEIIVFLICLTAGTIYSTSSKIIMDMQGNTGNVNDNEISSIAATFQKPLTLTLTMFFGMSLGLVLHLMVLLFRIPFPGYGAKVDSGDQESNRTGLRASLVESSSNCDDNDGAAPSMAIKEKSTVPTGMYFIMAVLDVAATALFMIGLQYVEVSIYQMLRGSIMVFVALMKQLVFKEHLYAFHWMGVFWNMMSVIITGLAALLVSSSSTGESGGNSDNIATTQSLFGIFLILAGSFNYAILSLLVEKRMKMEVPAPMIIGMIGIWGMVLSIFVLLPVGYWIPGNDNGSYEDPFHAWSMILHSRNIQVAMIVYCFSVFIYNIALSTLFCMLSSVWGGILENFRSIAVWLLDVVIFYCINSSFGESWTPYSYLQIFGMVVLLLGTAIYNAPNDCSIRLKGQWWALGINLSEEYDLIRMEQEKGQKVQHVDYLDYENLSEEYDAICQEKVDGEVV